MIDFVVMGFPLCGLPGVPQPCRFLVVHDHTFAGRNCIDCLCSQRLRRGKETALLAVCIRLVLRAKECDFEAMATPEIAVR